MCGITGYIGHREAYPIVINGLKRLEYRGYDSAGIFRFGVGMPEGKLIKYADEGNSHINCIDRVVE